MSSPTHEMQQFLLQENVRVFRARLAEATDEAGRHRVAELLAAAQRELSLLEAAHRGVQAPWRRPDTPETEAARAQAIERFHAEFDKTDLNASLLDPGPGLLFAAVGGIGDVAAGRPRSALVGQPLFSLFPENPGNPSAEGVRILYSGLRGAADTGAEQALSDFRYDVQNADGVFTERWWRSVCRPVFDDDKRLIFVCLISRDVTGEVLAARDG